MGSPSLASRWAKVPASMCSMMTMMQPPVKYACSPARQDDKLMAGAVGALTDKVDKLLIFVAILKP